MDKAKSTLDLYTEKTMMDSQYIAYDMLDSVSQDDILCMGEIILDKNEKQKGFPSLIGLDQQYSQVKVIFEPNFERRLVNLAHIVG